VKPLLPLVSSLVCKGADVVVATGDAVRADIEATGARHAPAGAGFAAWFEQLAARTRGQPGDGLPADRITHYFVPRLFAEVIAADMVDPVLAVGEQLRPDVVLFDQLAFAGPLVAKLLDARPVHHLFGPLLTADVLQLATDALSPMWRTFGLSVPPDAGMYDGVTVAICPASLDPAVPPRGEHLMLRPAPLPRRDPASRTPPLVYFSLGTMWANAEVVQAVLTALGDLPVRVVATLGALDPSDVATVPANVELHRFIPQQDVLPDASLVIHHAGAGTMFGALAHGLPQIALPQAADNFVNAQMLARAGAAAVLAPADVTARSVRDLVQRVLADRSFTDAARAIATEIAGMPSADDVAAALMT
jgi:UDP:flavonoid glycosyltransferase YjiC (YdhE family)